MLTFLMSKKVRYICYWVTVEKQKAQKITIRLKCEGEDSEAEGCGFEST